MAAGRFGFCGRLRGEHHTLPGRDPRLLLLVLACWLAAPGADVGAQAGDNFETLRNRMVERQIVARGITRPEVLEAMRSVPRHLFVDESLWEQAYEDQALPIGAAQGGASLSCAS